MGLFKLMAGVALCFSLQARADALQNISYNIMLRTYKALQAATDDMHAKIVVLQNEPTQDNLTAAQNAWRAMRVQWEASEGFLFGPVSELEIDPELDTWPLDRTALQGVLNSGEALTPDYVRNLGAELGGFHTVEFLLFGNGVNSNTQPVANVTPRVLQYLNSTVQLMQGHVNTLVSSWETGWVKDSSGRPYAELVATASGDTFEQPRDVYAQMVEGMMGIIGEVSSTKIANSFGGSIGAVDLEKEESPYSWNSLADFTDNVRSVLNVYTGEYMGVRQGEGLKDVLMEKDPALAQAVEDKIRDTMQRIQNIALSNPGGTFRGAITSPAGRPSVQNAIDGLDELFAMLQNEVLPAIVR